MDHQATGSQLQKSRLEKNRKAFLSNIYFQDTEQYIMSDDEERQQIARAMALSLKGLEAHFEQEQQEQHDMRAAIAASLGKTVDQLTARDMLLADASLPVSNHNNKRPREEEVGGSYPVHRVVKRFDNSESRFWNGTVKLTYVKGFVGPDYIRFEDIVQKVQ